MKNPEETFLSVFETPVARQRGKRFQASDPRARGTAGIGREPVLAERHLVGSGVPGTGGASLWAEHGEGLRASADRALRAVLDWNGASEQVSAPFPFKETLTHFQGAGRAHAEPELVVSLRDAHSRLPGRISMVEAWLPSTFDQEDGDYSSYICAPVFAFVAPEGGAPDADDALIATAMADLLLIETAALEATPHRRQQVRAKAAARALTRLAELAPSFGVDAQARDAAVSELSRGAGEPGPAGRGLAESVVGSVRFEIREAVDLALLPTTRLHDELMFIRCIQVFEGVYRRVAVALNRARDGLSVGDHVSVRAELEEAATRVEAMPVLFRILTTMPVDVFAVIRAYTNGRSAVQSRAYHEVEYVSAPRNPGPDAEGSKRPDPGGPTLEEIYLKERERVPSEVTAAMTRLDRAWRAMKLSHWGITLKIIGDVPGTGGTSGASYLRTAADTALFPCLAQDGGRP